MTDETSIQTECRAWFAEAWDPDLALGEWWDRFAQSGWAFPTWPPGWFGQGLEPEAARQVEQERVRAGAAAMPRTLGTKAIAPLLISHGSDDQRERYLYDTITGRAVWCELFSEPGAGSDLAGLATRARRQGDGWVVNGQKVWTSGAPISKWGLLAARTDPDVPKHRGLTFFVVDMNAGGVECRPLRTMAGEEKFSEVFLTDVKVSDSDVVGELDGGWEIVRRTLAIERASIGPGSGTGGMADNNRLPRVDEPAGRMASMERSGQQRGAMMTGAGGMAMIRALLDHFGGFDDATVRQDWARLYCMSEVVRLTGLRNRAAVIPPVGGPELKLLSGRVTLALRDLALRIEGADGMLSGADAALGGVVQRLFLTSPSMSIVAGTDEIQRNLIGERTLGLPPEPITDRAVPWRNLPRS